MRDGVSAHARVTIPRAEEPDCCAQFQAYGLCVQMAMPADCAKLTRERLPPTWTRTSLDREPDRHYVISRVDGGFLANGGPALSWAAADAVSIVELVLSDAELWVAEHSRRRIFVHAGVVGWKEKAIMLPGRTMSGKSSLTAALVRNGARYYSDEFAPLDSAGQVRPYARPLCLRPYAGGPTRRVPVAEFGGHVGRGPLPVGLVALVRYDPMATTFAPSPMSPALGLLGLLDNTIPAKTRPRASLSALHRVMLTATAVEGPRGDADEAAAALLALAQW